MLNPSPINNPAGAPVNIARETIKQIALRRVDPTPDNYEAIYNEIAGIKNTTPKKGKGNAEAKGEETDDAFMNAFKKALRQLPNQTTDQHNWIHRWEKIITKADWDKLSEILHEGMGISIKQSTQWPEAIRSLLTGWETRYTRLTLTQKKEMLERVLINYGGEQDLPEKISGMIKAWEQFTAVQANPESLLIAQTEQAGSANKLIEIDVQAEAKTEVVELKTAETNVMTQSDVSNSTADDANALPDYDSNEFHETFRILQDILKQSLINGLVTRLDGYPELKDEALTLVEQSESARKLKDWQSVAKSFRALLVRVELIGANEEGMKQDLLRLLKLLIDNISELVSEDEWLRGQISVVQTIVSSPLERALIQDAEKSLKEVIYKQGMLKHSLSEAKGAFKTMIATFMDRLAYMTESSGTYHEKVETYSEKLLLTEDILEINELLENLMNDTSAMQTDIVRSRDALLEQREHVDRSQEEIRKLQQELVKLSDTVRTDQLTGVLNRRGLDEALKVEIARAHRSQSQLSVAFIDIDNFKAMNDTYGHDVGDRALQHLAKLMQDTVRPTDVVSRLGGEEFVVLLPDTNIDEAVITVTRLQRALTKTLFMQNNQKLLITFSAGISLLKTGESEASVVGRADQAMYLAKKTGKNRVMTEVDADHAHHL
jgi:diguanylate cyclase